MKLDLRGALLPGLKTSRLSTPSLAFLGEKGGEGSFQSRIGDFRLLVRDAAGKAFESTGNNGNGFGDSMSYEIQMKGLPAKITVSAAARVEKREVPFRFTDIPLPR